MWGCKVVWNNHGKDDEPKWHEEWMWGAIENDDGTTSFPLMFVEKRSEIMPLVRYMRDQPHVRSAKSVRVRIPDLT